MVTVKNRANGTESTFTNDEWAKIEKSPQWQGVFEVVQGAKVEKPSELSKDSADKKDLPAAGKTMGKTQTK